MVYRGQRERISTGVDLSDSHFISQHRVSVEFVTMQQEHGSKNLPCEQFVLILSATCRPRLDRQMKCVELLCLPHIHVFRFNSILEISQSILRVSALVEGRLYSITE